MELTPVERAKGYRNVKEFFGLVWWERDKLDVSPGLGEIITAGLHEDYVTALRLLQHYKIRTSTRRVGEKI